MGLLLSQFGQPCLLEDVEEQLDYVLEPVLGKQVFKQNQVEYIKVGGELIEYSRDFRLYMTTRLANPHLEVCHSSRQESSSSRPTLSQLARSPSGA